MDSGIYKLNVVAYLGMSIHVLPIRYMIKVPKWDCLKFVKP